MIDKNSIIKKHFLQLLIYEFSYIMAASLIIVPIVMDLYNSFIKENNYSTIPFLVLSFFILLSIIIIIFNKISLVIILDDLLQHNKTNIKECLKKSVKKTSSLLNINNLGYFLIYLFYLLFLYLTIFEYLTIHYLKYFDISFDLIILILLVFTILLLFTFKYIYYINYLILGKKKNTSVFKSSSNIIKGHLNRDISSLLGIHLIMIPILFIAIILSKELLISSFLNSTELIWTISNSIVWIINTLFLSLYIILINICLSYNLHNHKVEHKEKIKENIQEKGYLLIPKTLKATAVLFALFICVYTIREDIVNSLKEPYMPEITAHRGASIDYPENTMAAFKGAVKDKADWIEIDVRPTIDGKYVIHHDETVYRITGRHGVVSDMTYNELCTLDCGSFFDSKYSKERMPLLEDVIKFAKKNNTKLVIELKNNHEEINYYEKDIVKLIHKYNFVDSCIVESPYYKQLRNIKRIDPNIQTLFLADYMVEDFLYLDDVDVYAVSQTYLNSYWINRIHEQGKKVFVWTLDSEDAMKQFIYLKVDNITTDDINLAKEVIANWQEETANSSKE